MSDDRHNTQREALNPGRPGGPQASKGKQAKDRKQVEVTQGTI